MDPVHDYVEHLFLFVLALFSAWSWQLLPHRIIHMFDHSRRAQLVVLFLLIVFTLDFLQQDRPFTFVFHTSLVHFFLYLILTKQSKHFFIASVALLACANLIDRRRHRSSVGGGKWRTYTYILYGIMVGLIASTLVGVTLYWRKQRRDHPEKNLLRFSLRFLLEGSRSQRKEAGEVFGKEPPKKA